jgi:hypothetical protein
VVIEGGRTFRTRGTGLRRASSAVVRPAVVDDVPVITAESREVGELGCLCDGEPSATNQPTAPSAMRRRKLFAISTPQRRPPALTSFCRWLASAGFFWSSGSAPGDLGQMQPCVSCALPVCSEQDTRAVPTPCERAAGAYCLCPEWLRIPTAPRATFLTRGVSPIGLRTVGLAATVLANGRRQDRSSSVRCGCRRRPR